MPDDKKQVAEQTDQELDDEFDAAFAEEEEKPDESSDEQEENEEEEEEEESEESEEPDEDKEGKEDEDDLLARGKKLLDEEAEKEKEAEAAKNKAEKAEAKKKAEEEAVKPINETDMESLASMIKATDFPKEVEINGVTFNTRDFLEDNPEATVVAGLAAARTLERMVKNKVLWTGKQVEEKLKEQQDLIWGNVFASMVSMWHSDAEALVQSKEFTGWLDGSPKEYQQLWRSGNPLDAIEILNRYKEDKITNEDDKKNKETAKEAAAKAKATREKHEKLHRKTTPKKPTPTIPGLEDMGNTDDDFAVGFNED